MSTVIESLPIQFAGLRGKGRIPAWAKLWNVNSTTLEMIKGMDSKPGIVVIQSREPAEMVEQGQDLPLWSKATAAANPYVVVEFAETHEHSADELAEVLRLFPGTRQVEFAYGPSQLKGSLMQSMAKYLVHGDEPIETGVAVRGDKVVKRIGVGRSAPKTATATDALGEAREVIAAIRPLLAPSGRLSAPKVAAQFGLSTAKLGRLIGSSRQALGKTPDAPSIQEGLRPFERVARLRAILSESHFRAWLERANRHLDDQTPRQIIESGRAGIVADLVEDMLLGTPS